VLTEAILSVRDLEVVLETGRGPLRAVNKVSFDIRPGEAYGIVGESGSGKSVTALSILRLLARNARIVSGSVLFKGRDVL